MPATPNTIYRVIDSPTTFNYATVLADGRIVESASLKRAIGHAGLAWDSRDVVIIDRADWDRLINPVKWYLKCEDCGEVFDSVDAAAAHAPDDCPDFNIDTTYTLVSEEEAF